MKRGQESSEEAKPGPLLGLILAHPDKNLRIFILSRCYRSAGALACTCKLLSLLVKERQFWRYGIAVEFGRVMKDCTWSLQRQKEVAERFDPFAWPWPSDMPAVPVRAYGSTLAWIFNDECIRVGYDYGHEDFVYKVCVCDATHEQLFEWQWNPGVEEWLVLHSWLNPEQLEDWQLLSGCIIHVYWKSRKDPRGASEVAYASFKGQAQEKFWMDRYDPSAKKRFVGYCTPCGGLAGVCKWVDESPSE